MSGVADQSSSSHEILCGTEETDPLSPQLSFHNKEESSAIYMETSETS